MVDREQIIAALTEMSETEYQLTINEARGHRTADAKQLVVDALRNTFGHSTPKETE